MDISFISLIILFQKKGNPIRKLRHSTQKQTPFCQKHNVSHFSCHDFLDSISQIWNRRCDMSLCRRKTRHPMNFNKAIEVNASDFVTKDGKASYGAVIGSRYIATSLGLRDFGIMHFGRIFIYLGELKPQTIQRLHDQVFEYGLLGGSCADLVFPYGVQTDSRAFAIVRAYPDGKSAKNIFQNRHIVMYMAMIFHP